MRLSDYKKNLRRVINDELDLIGELVYIERYMIKITEDAYRQKSITKDEYDGIMGFINWKVETIKKLNDGLRTIQDRVIPELGVE
jgi:hypothetical protein